MGDWPQGQDYNRVTIHTGSVESLGVEHSASNLNLSVAAAWPAANRAIFVPFVVHAPLTVVKMFTLTGASSGNVDVGIYDTGQHRLVSAGSTAMAGTNAIQIYDVTDTILAAGVYYFGVALDNGTGTIQASAAAVPVASGWGVLSQSTAFPLPDPAAFAAVQDAFVPLVGLTARTVV